MAFINNKSRPSTKQTTSQIRSYKASCAVVFHQYESPDITKLVNANAQNDKQMANTANASSSGNLKAKANLIIRQDIVRCTVANDKSGVGGTFSIVIKKGKEIKGGVNTSTDVPYLRSINPGDWVTIYMKRNSEITNEDLKKTTSASGLKMLGIVETVREVEVDDPQSGTPRLDFVVSGRSFGKVFDTNIFFNPVINQQAMETVLGADFIKDSGKVAKPLANNTPDSLVKRVVKFYLEGSGTSRSQANENWFVPLSVTKLFKGEASKKGQSFSKIVDTTRVGLHKYIRNKFSSAARLPGNTVVKALPTTGTIWSVMQFFQNSSCNEMFTELVPDSSGNLQPGLVLRQLPFSNRDGQETNVFQANKTYKGAKAADSGGSKTYFVDLPRYEIVSSDIRQKNVGKSDHERINYVIVTPRILDATVLDFAFIAGSNPPSIQRYGLKMFQTQTSYVLGGIKNYCAKLVSLLQDWFFLSHNLFNGTLLLDGVNPFVEVGSNIYIKDIKHLYHVEGYTHNYSIGANGNSEYTSEFRVSRGQRFDNGKSTFIGDSKTSNDPTTVCTSFVARGTK